MPVLLRKRISLLFLFVAVQPAFRRPRKFPSPAPAVPSLSRRQGPQNVIEPLWKDGFSLPIFLPEDERSSIRPCSKHNPAPFQDDADTYSGGQRSAQIQDTFNSPEESMQKFPKYKHHICLVSEQTLPNYLGATEPGAEPKTVHLVVSKKMKGHADVLTKALTDFGIEVVSYPLEGFLPEDMEKVLKSIFMATGKESIAINVTGGTKVMALTAVNWAVNQNGSAPFLFYVDTAQEKLLHVGKPGVYSRIQRRLSLQEILKACAGVDSAKQTAEYPEPAEQAVLERLLQAFISNPGHLHYFNELAYDAKVHSGLHAKIDKSKEDPGFEKILSDAVKVGKITVTADTINYTSKEARQWCNGGWLERYTFSVICKLYKENYIDSFAGNIIIYDNKNQKIKKYEIDAGFTSHNNLYVIECKTGKLESTDQPSLENLKIDHIKRNLGGIQAKGLIVCIEKPSKLFIEHCKYMRNEIIYGQDLIALHEKLLEWIRQSAR